MSSEPIRILQVIGSMNRGGAETMIMNLYRAIDRDLVQFDFVENCSDEAAYDAEIERLGGKIYRCPHYNGKNHFSYRKWWKQFFEDHSDENPVVHGHLGSTAAIYLSVAKKHGLFTIAHSHNTLNGFSLSNLAYSIYTFPTRHIADYFMACGEKAAVSRFGKKIASDPVRCSLLNNAIETSHFAFDPASGDEVRTRFNIQGKRIIGHVGRFNAQKNHRFLIEIFNEILKKDPNSVLMMIGDGSLKNDIVNLVKEKGIESSVIFAGIQSDVAPFYSAMDVLVFPSLYEGLPVTLVESQTSGLPAVISEFVPGESVLVPDLFDIVSLQDSLSVWAEKVLAASGKERRSRIREVTERGYDIHETAALLCEFYRKKALEHK